MAMDSPQAQENIWRETPHGRQRVAENAFHRCASVPKTMANDSPKAQENIWREAPHRCQCLGDNAFHLQQQVSTSSLKVWFELAI